jgi:hypothetical protein
MPPPADKALHNAPCHHQDADHHQRVLIEIVVNPAPMTPIPLGIEGAFS